MYRYFINGNSVERKKIDFEFTTPLYDDVVDRSTWSPCSDSMNNRIANSGSTGSKGVFDDPDRLPSDLEVRIRSGKLDKTEVALAIQQFIEESKNANDAKKESESLAQAKKIAEARQAYLDAATGFKTPSEINS